MDLNHFVCGVESYNSLFLKSEAGTRQHGWPEQPQLIIIAVIELTTSLCFEVLVPWIILKGTYCLKLLMKGFSSLIT